jgi:hypothetical protein
MEETCKESSLGHLKDAQSQYFVNFIVASKSIKK